MKALTIYQPWASLIMAGAKPHEFRGHDYRRRCGSVEGQHIVIHASARKIDLREVDDVIERLNEDAEVPTGLKLVPALELLLRLRIGSISLPLACGLGTAILGTPIRCTELFADQVVDSDRIDEHKWAWPLTDLQPFEPIVPMLGAQGFWNWPGSAVAGQHVCHAEGCSVPVPPQIFMCRRHWFMVPKPLRDEIWRTYRAGQEIDKKPSADYRRTAREAVKVVAAREGKGLPHAGPRGVSRETSEGGAR